MHVEYSNDSLSRADYIHSGVLCASSKLQPPGSRSYIYCPFSPDTAPSNPCTSSSFDSHFHYYLLSPSLLLQLLLVLPGSTS